MNDHWPPDKELFEGMDNLHRRLHRSWKCQLLCLDTPRGCAWRATVAPNTYQMGVSYIQRVNPSYLIEGFRFCLMHNEHPFKPHSVLWDTRSLVQDHIYPSFLQFYQHDNPPTRNRIIERLQYQFHGNYVLRHEIMTVHVYNGTFEFKLSIPTEIHENNMDSLVIRALRSGIMLWFAQVEWVIHPTSPNMDLLTLRCHPLHIHPTYQKQLYDRTRLKCVLRYTRERDDLLNSEDLAKRFTAMLTDSNGYGEIKRHISRRLGRTLQDHEVQLAFMKHQSEYDVPKRVIPCRILVNYLVKVFFSDFDNYSISANSDMNMIDTLVSEDILAT